MAQESRKCLLLKSNPKVAPVQVWGCTARARDIFGTPGPSPKKTTCSFSYRFRGNLGIRGLYQAIRVAIMGCFRVDFQEVKRPLRTKSGKRPMKVGKRPNKEGKRPIKAMVLVGMSVSCLMGCLRAPPPWWKTAPLKRPLKRSMTRGKIHPKDRENPEEIGKVPKSYFASSPEILCDYFFRICLGIWH